MGEVDYPEHVLLHPAKVQDSNLFKLCIDVNRSKATHLHRNQQIFGLLLGLLSGLFI